MPQVKQLCMGMPRGKQLYGYASGQITLDGYISTQIEMVISLFK
jgi:hypothetical protein